MRPLGFTDTKPFMERISFRKEGYMAVYFKDGRMVYVPLSRFPTVESLSAIQRRRYHIAGGEFLMFQDDDEIYHIQDFLGTHESNTYKTTSQHLAA